MAIQPINVGAAPNDGTGDAARDAFQKINENFDELSALATPETSGLMSAEHAQRLEEITSSGEHQAAKWGVINTGLVDTHAQINQAILEISQSGGGVLVLGAGRYLVSEPILMRDNVILRGVGYATHLIATSTYSNRGIIRVADEANGNEYFVVRDLRIDGNQPARSEYADISSLFLRGTRRVLLENLYVLDNTRHAIALESIGDGLLAGINQNVIINNCFIDGVGDDGITTHNCRGVTIANSILSRGNIEGPGQSVGIEIDDGSEGVTVTGCIVREGGWQAALDIKSHSNISTASYVTVTGCYFEGQVNFAPGDDIGGDSRHLVVSNCVIKPPLGQRGILFRDDGPIRNVTITGCTIDTTTADRAAIENGGNIVGQVLIANCDIRSKGTSSLARGIWLSSLSESAVVDITGCTIDATRHCISTSGGTFGRVNIRGNTITGDELPCIALEGTQSGSEICLNSINRTPVGFATIRIGGGNVENRTRIFGNRMTGGIDAGSIAWFLDLFNTVADRNFISIGDDAIVHNGHSLKISLNNSQIGSVLSGQRLRVRLAANSTSNDTLTVKAHYQQDGPSSSRINAASKLFGARLTSSGFDAPQESGIDQIGTEFPPANIQFVHTGAGATFDVIFANTSSANAFLASATLDVLVSRRDGVRIVEVVVEAIPE